MKNESWIAYHSPIPMSTKPSDNRSLVESRKAPKGVTFCEMRATAPSSMSQTPAASSTRAAMMKCPRMISGIVAALRISPAIVRLFGVMWPATTIRVAKDVAAPRMLVVYQSLTLMRMGRRPGGRPASAHQSRGRCQRSSGQRLAIAIASGTSSGATR